MTRLEKLVYRLRGIKITNTTKKFINDIYLVNNIGELILVYPNVKIFTFANREIHNSINFTAENGDFIHLCAPYALVQRKEDNKE